MTPARARRREVYFSLSLLPDAANRGQAIGIFIPEKAERRIPQSKYPDDNCLRTMVTSADRSGTKQNKIIKGDTTMQKTRMKKTLSALVCAVLVAAIALGTFGCGQKPTEGETNAVTTEFKFSVTDADGKTTDFTVTTNKKIVGEALQDEGLISGEEGQYGLYVKTVNGITLDYETDGMYWAFYVNDTMAPTGVDMTEIKPGEVYSFKAEK